MSSFGQISKEMPTHGAEATFSFRKNEEKIQSFGANDETPFWNPNGPEPTPSTPRMVAFDADQEVRRNSVIQNVHYETLDYCSKVRNNIEVVEVIARNVDLARQITSSGDVFEYKEVHDGYSSAEDGHWEVNNDENHLVSSDNYELEEHSKDCYTKFERHVDQTFYKRFYTTFSPPEYDIEEMDFEYQEDLDEFQSYDLVVSTPEQESILCADNFNQLLDKIVPWAEERGRLEDVDMTENVNVLTNQMTVQKRKATPSEMSMFKDFFTTNEEKPAQLCLEYNVNNEPEEAHESSKKPSKMKRLRKFCRRLNAFSGLVCGSIVRRLVKNFNIM